MRFILAVLLSLSPSLACAQAIPFRFEKSIGSASEDPLTIWKPDEIDSTFAGNEDKKALTPSQLPIIQEYRMPTADGTLIISQLWDASCSSNLCPTRIVLVKPDGSQVLEAEDMMQQVVPPDKQNAGKGIGDKPPFSLSADGKTVNAITSDGNTVQYPIR